MISLVFQNGDKVVARGAVDSVQEIPPENESICLLDEERGVEREFRVQDVKRKYVLNRLPGSRQIIIEATVFMVDSLHRVGSDRPDTPALYVSAAAAVELTEGETKAKRGRNARR
jgi:hypothetical protein